MVTDDLFLRVLEPTRDLGALTMVHARTAGRSTCSWSARSPRARPTRSTTRTRGRRRSRPRPRTARCASPSWPARAVYIVHVTCGLAADEIAAGQARGVDVSGETCLQYLTNTVEDLERPDFEGARYVCSPPLREAHNQELLWGALDRGVLESVSTDHCPFNSEQKALGRDDFSKIPNGLAMIQHRLVKLWDLGVESGRITPERARRPDLDGDRAALRPGPQGLDRAREGRRPRRVRPRHAVRVLHPHVAHERRLRPVRGRDVHRQRAPHVLPRRRSSTTAARSAPSPATGASCRARWRAARRVSVADGRRPRARRPARAGEPDRRPGRRPARLLDRRVGARARVPALAARRAAGARSRSTRRATSGPSCPASRRAS